MKDVYLTKEQKVEIEKDLEYYIHTRRKEVVERIKEAKSFGDLSENSEYDSAREEQAFVEAKIKELEAMLSGAKIISENVDTNTVGLGTEVTFANLTEKKEYTYKIVGVGANPLDETNPSISSSTPIARKLLGKKINDIVDVDIPSGKIKLQVKKIQ